MTIYNKRKAFKRHIVYLRNGKSRAFQIATPQHIAFVASVGSVFGETMVCVMSLIPALRSSSLCLLCGMRYINKLMKCTRVPFKLVNVEIQFAEAT